MLVSARGRPSPAEYNRAVASNRAGRASQTSRRVVLLLAFPAYCLALRDLPSAWSRGATGVLLTWLPFLTVVFLAVIARRRRASGRPAG
jgi:hypothetical protein